MVNNAFLCVFQLVNQAHRCKEYKKEYFLYLMHLHMGRLAISNRFLSELPNMPGFVAPNKKGVDRMNLLIKCVMKDLENRMVSATNKLLKLVSMMKLVRYSGILLRATYHKRPVLGEIILKLVRCSHFSQCEFCLQFSQSFTNLRF